ERVRLQAVRRTEHSAHALLLGAQRALAQTSYSIHLAALVFVRGTFAAFNQALVKESLEGDVQVAGGDSDCPAAGLLDFLRDRVTMSRTAEQDGEHVEVRVTQARRLGRRFQRHLAIPARPRRSPEIESPGSSALGSRRRIFGHPS